MALFLLFACVTDGGDASGPDDPAPDDTALDDTGDPCASAAPLFAGCPTLTVVGTAADGLVVPRDLAFAPETGLLWVADAAFSGTVIYTDPGAATQTAEVRVDAYAGHFMDTVSGLAFGPDDTFATCQESRDDWNVGPQAEDDFMGPTLWDADLDVYAVVGQTGTDLEGSHIDMLHESPWCMGIAHDHDNVYWVFDGLNGSVVYYDFVRDHGAGHSDHSDGIVRRYEEAALTRVEGVPGHLVLDDATGWLYVADTGTGRVLRLDTATGEASPIRNGAIDRMAEYSRVSGVTVETFASGLGEPSGLALADGVLYVGDHATGEIVAYDLDGNELDRLTTGAAGLMGLEVGPDGKLWYVDAATPSVVRVDPAP
jgi:DNA-binding beta-propeller fold protein YncE